MRFWSKIYLLLLFLFSFGAIAFSISAQTAGFYCASELDVPVTTSFVVECDGGYHVEGDTCVSNTGAGKTWQGNTFNGYWVDN